MPRCRRYAACAWFVTGSSRVSPVYGECTAASLKVIGHGLVTNVAFVPHRRNMVLVSAGRAARIGRRSRSLIAT